MANNRSIRDGHMSLHLLSSKTRKYSDLVTVRSTTERKLHDLNVSMSPVSINKT